MSLSAAWKMLNQPFMMRQNGRLHLKYGTLAWPQPSHLSSKGHYGCHRLPRGSHHRLWLLGPSSKVCRWKCFGGLSSGPAAHSRQSQLQSKKLKIRIIVCLTGVSHSRKCKFHLVIIFKCAYWPSLTSALSVRRTFWPLISLWMTLLAWRWERPRRISREMKAIHSSFRLWPLVAVIANKPLSHHPGCCYNYNYYYYYKYHCFFCCHYYSNHLCCRSQDWSWFWLWSNYSFKPPSSPHATKTFKVSQLTFDKISDWASTTVLHH